LGATEGSVELIFRRLFISHIHTFKARGQRIGVRPWCHG
jgi:hypothetical protein